MSEEKNVKLPFKAEWARNYIVEVVQDYEAKIDKLNEKIALLTNKPKNEPLLPYKHHPVKIKQDSGTTYHPKVTYLVTLEQLKQYQKEDEVIYEENKKIIARNQKSAETFITYLESLGLKKTKSEFKSGRSMKKHEVEQAWVGEVRSLFTIYNNTCPYDLYRWSIEEVEKYEKAERERVRNDQAAAEQLKKEQDYKIFIMSLIKRYNLPEDTLFKSADDVAEMLAHKSKYLFLARYLAKNRGDWTDGYSYAQQGLDEFDIGPTPIDKEIVEEISGLIRNWDGDGRVFRDCEWNYDRIFAHVAEIMPELYADYCKIHEMESFV